MAQYEQLVTMLRLSKLRFFQLYKEVLFRGSAYFVNESEINYFRYFKYLVFEKHHIPFKSLKYMNINQAKIRAVYFLFVVSLFIKFR